MENLESKVREVKIIGLVTCVLLLVLTPRQVLSVQALSTLDELEVRKIYLPPTYSEPREEVITHIMIHSISNVIENPNEPYRIVDLYLLLLEYGVSTHYLIDREGNIYQLVPEDRVAYHAGRSNFPYLPFFPHNMNQFSIGIELMGIGTKGEIGPSVPDEVYDSLDKSLIGFTVAQYKSLNMLLQDLHHRYPTISKSRLHVIGHEDYAPDRKQDPGMLFDWGKINY